LRKKTKTAAKQITLTGRGFCWEDDKVLANERLKKGGTRKEAKASSTTQNKKKVR